MIGKLAIISTLVAAILVGVVLLRWETCERSNYREFQSPDGIHGANLYTEDCGATTNFVTKVEIDGSTVFEATGAYSKKILVKWDNKNHLVITYLGKPDDILSKKAGYKNIAISILQE